MRRRISGVLGAAGQAGGADGGGSSGPYVDDVFSTYVYTGEGGSQDIENGIDLDGEGGLVWTKDRLLVREHNLFDTERGAKYYLSTDSDGKQDYKSKSGNSFNSNGFTLSDADGGLTNFSGREYVSWTFRKSPKFFDCITYTGTGVARDIPHNLGVEPGMVIIKSLDRTYKWIVSHRGLANLSEYLSLNETSAKSTDDKVFGSSSDSHTATTFHVGTDSYGNQIGDKYVAYVFAHDDSDESMIKCGSYIGAGSTEVDITLGWEPQWVMIKNATDTSGDAQPTRCAWNVIDVVRGWTADGIGNYVSANDSDAETKLATITPKANGFSVSSPNTGNSGDTYIYMAIRRPNKPAVEFEPEELFAVESMQDQSPSFTSGFPVDMGMNTRPSASYSNIIIPRLTDAALEAQSSAAEWDASVGFDYMDGYIDQSWQVYTPDLVSWMWRRAPGHFDVVCYEGDGQLGREVPHNLSVAPEMILVKSRNNATNWAVYHKESPASSKGGTANLRLHVDAAADTSSSFWPTQHTEADFNLGDRDESINAAAYTYIAYLFASVPGISKVGSYTGNGGSIEVDCGFTNGASWVLVKRTDADGDWWMTSAPSAIHVDMIALNKTDASFGGSGFGASYTYPQGFKVINGNGGLNTDGAEYIFYAIA